MGQCAVAMLLWWTRTVVLCRMRVVGHYCKKVRTKAGGLCKIGECASVLGL